MFSHEFPYSKFESDTILYLLGSNSKLMENYLKIPKEFKVIIKIFLNLYFKILYDIVKFLFNF